MLTRAATLARLRKRRRERRLAGDCIAHWNLDDTAFAIDATGNGHALSKVGAPPTNVAGKFDFAVSTSAGNALNTPSVTDLNPGAGDFTVSGWFYAPLYPGSVAGLVSKGTLGAMEFTVKLNSAGNLLFGLFTDGSSGSSLIGTQVALTNQWNFFCAWRDLAAGRMFVQLNATTPDFQTFGSGIFVGASPFYIGYDESSGTYFVGQLDVISFWKRALTDRERVQLFKSGRGNLFPFRFAR
jgi:hypothetical protein